MKSGLQGKKLLLEFSRARLLGECRDKDKYASEGDIGLSRDNLRSRIIPSELST